MKWRQETFQKKKIQNNDSEDDPGPQKKNRGKDPEDARNIRQRPKRIKEQTPKIIKEQTEINNTIIEMKNTLEGINSRITEAEERKSELED